MTDQQISRRPADVFDMTGEPHEVIGATLFLCSDAGSCTSCATLRVDGGIP